MNKLNDIIRNIKKNKAIVDLPILIFVSVLLIFFISMQINEHQLSPREQYEQFILSECRNFPDPSIPDDESLRSFTRPDLAAFQNYLMTLDPELGRVPVERLKYAIEETKRLQNERGFKSSANLEWEGTGAFMGGRSRAIMFDPNDPETTKLWAGGVTGGLWYNDNIQNNSSEWIPVDDFWLSLSISCITYDPNSTNVFYVGTGEVETAFTTYRESSGVGVGIFKTANGGDYWQLLSSTEDFKYVTDIAVRDEDGISAVYAGVASGYYHGATHQSEPTDGLYRSTNGGSTWEQVLPNITDLDIPYAVSDVAIGADGRIYVGTIQNVNGDGGATILYSDEGTAGTWTVYEEYRIIIENGYNFDLPGRVIMAPAPSDEDIVYAIIAAGFNDGFDYYYGRYILKSEDKGNSWSTINKPNSSGDWANLAWHAMIGVVNPQNPNALYVGGLDVWNTFNGGNNWNHISDWALMYYGGGEDYVHADQHEQIYRPGHPDEMCFSSDGGIFYTNQADTKDPVFQERNNNFNTLQFYTCAISPVAGKVEYVGGLQDNGSLLYTGTPLSIDDMVSGGDGAYCFFDKNEPEIMITSTYYNSYDVFRHGSKINDIGWQSGIFINPVDYDYKENNIYANAVSFFNNRPNRILRIKDVTGYASTDFVDLGTDVTTWFSHVKYSPYSPSGTSTLFLGTNSGRLFKVTNAHSTPEVEEIGVAAFPTANISCIALGSTEDTMLVTFSNYGVISVWQTVNGGATWQNREGNLPDMPIRWAIYHPDNSGQAMLATECGIYETNELKEKHTNWYPANEGMANVRVDMIKLRDADNAVLAATHGRGFFTTTYNLNPYTGTGERSVSYNVKAYPNPASDIINIQIDNNNVKYLEISLNDLSGKNIINEKINIPSGSFSRKYDLSELSEGMYLLTVKSNKSSTSKKIIVR